MKTTALDLGPYGIRANSIHPWGVDTPMGYDQEMARIVREHREYRPALAQALPPPMLAPPDEISTAVLYLAGDGSRLVTGIQLPVDMGATIV